MVHVTYSQMYLREIRAKPPRTTARSETASQSFENRIRTDRHSFVRRLGCNVSDAKYGCRVTLI